MHTQGQLRYRNIQSLRALAALSVVFQHLHDPFVALGLPVPTGGVDLFFVISGFIIAHSARGVMPATFMLRRTARIVPLYWFMTIVTVAAASLAPGLFHNTSANLGDFLRSIFFIPFMKGVDSSPLPTLPVGWSLNYEMGFYAIFALGLWLRRDAVRFALVALCALVIVGFTFQPENTVLRFFTAPTFLKFGFGMVIALAPSTRIPRSVLLAMLVASAPLALFGRDVLPGGTLIGGSLLVFSAVQLEQRGLSTGWGNMVGDASYSLYLSHIFVTSFALLLYGALGPVSAGGVILCSVVAAILLALALHRWIEIPLTGEVAALLVPHPPGAAAVTALTVYEPDAVANLTEVSPSKL